MGHLEMKLVTFVTWWWKLGNDGEAGDSETWGNQSQKRFIVVNSNET
jgi:hypothetical protein